MHRLWFGRCFAAEDQPYLDGCFVAEVQPYLVGVHGYRRVLSWAAGAMDPRMMRCLLAGPLLGGSLVAAGEAVWVQKRVLDAVRELNWRSWRARCVVLENCSKIQRCNASLALCSFLKYVHLVGAIFKIFCHKLTASQTWASDECSRRPLRTRMDIPPCGGGSST